MAASWYQRLTDPLLERLSVRRTRDSVVLADVEAASGDQDGLDRLEAALDALKQADVRRYHRVLRQFRAIHLVALEAYGGQYRHASRTCHLDRALVMSRPPRETASRLVHEATHGRLMDRGIGYEPTIRSRVERACDREQARFLERAGVPIEALERFRTRLGRTALTDLELLEGEERMLLAHGISPRVARLLSAPRRWWLSRHSQEVSPAVDEVGQRSAPTVGDELPGSEGGH